MHRIYCDWMSLTTTDMRNWVWLEELKRTPQNALKLNQFQLLSNHSKCFSISSTCQQKLSSAFSKLARFKLFTLEKVTHSNKAYSAVQDRSSANFRLGLDACITLYSAQLNDKKRMCWCKRECKRKEKAKERISKNRIHRVLTLSVDRSVEL